MITDEFWLWILVWIGDSSSLDGWAIQDGNKRVNRFIGYNQKQFFLVILIVKLKHLSDSDTKTEHYMNEFGNEHRFHRIITTTINGREFSL